MSHEDDKCNDKICSYWFISAKNLVKFKNSCKKLATPSVILFIIIKPLKIRPFDNFSILNTRTNKIILDISETR